MRAVARLHCALLAIKEVSRFATEVQRPTGQPRLLSLNGPMSPRGPNCFHWESTHQSCNRRLRGTTNYFIVSLAVADICVGLLGIPFAIVTYLGFPDNFHGCLMMLSFIIITTQSSIFSLLAIAVDRYVAIMNPLRYEYLMTTRTARWAIALTWALSLLIGMVPLMGWNLGPSQNGCAFTAVIDFDYFVYFNFFGCVLTPLLIMGFIYSTIFWSVRKQLRSIKSTDITTSAIEKKKKYFKKEVKAAKSLAIIVGLFAVCWLPLHTLNCIDHLCREACPYPYELLMTAILLSHANSAVNPVIYAFRNRDYRNTFKSLVQSCFFCCPWTETVFNLSDQSVSESRQNQIQLNAFNRSQMNLIHEALSQSQPAVNQLNSRSPSRLSVVQEPTENVIHENSKHGFHDSVVHPDGQVASLQHKNKRKWFDKIREDLHHLNLDNINPQDRYKWRAAIKPQLYSASMSNPRKTGNNRR
ncbi:Adenosine receptor A2a [Branchiostoma belcheri]|nr:Adenosine receptor A2a [Branchiostoma belcheri]